MGEEEIAPWLKSLPLAPEYRPTEAEFADPIGYILKIEKEAIQYGICKIVPPFPKPSKKQVISNLNRSLIESQDNALAGVHGSSSAYTVSRNMNSMLATGAASQIACNNKREIFEGGDAGDGDGKARFTTRLQQIGWNSRKIRGPMQSVVQKPVWESGESYTLEQFEAKARIFYRSRLGTGKEFSPLAIETLFWKAAADKPITVEYANDIPGTAFGEPSETFTNPYPPLGRKQKLELKSQVFLNNANRNGNMQQIDVKDKDTESLSVLNDDETEDTPVVSTESSETVLCTDNLESPMAGKIEPDKMSDTQADGNKSMDGISDREAGVPGWKLSNSGWNMRIVARSPGSLIRHMPDEVPGVTTPMVYIGMLFSWFAWHVEDHELHSLNYLHIGSPKTWYAVPGDAAASLEDVIRVQGYGEHLNPLAAFAILGEKTTLMSPEILIRTGVPCCRLVQNPGEFVITFPRAYHLGFSHGFNCGEAANIATPSWLKVAKEAAIRRAAMNYLPMLSHQQLLYMLSLSFPSWIPAGLVAEPRSSRLKDRKKSEGELAVKNFFVHDMIHNNLMLNVLLEKECTCYAVLWDSADVPSGSTSVSSRSPQGWRSPFGVSSQEALQSDMVINTGTIISREEGLPTKGTMDMHKLPDSPRVNKLCDSRRVRTSSDECKESLLKCIDSSMDIHDEKISVGGVSLHSDLPSGDSMRLDTGTLACVACGILGFPCMAIIQPSEAAATNFHKVGFNVVDKNFAPSEVGSVGKHVASTEVAASDTQSTADNCTVDFLLETPIALVSNCINYQDEVGQGLCGQLSEVDTVGDCTASLVHASILAPSTKDVERDFIKRGIQYNEYEPTVAHTSRSTEMNSFLAQNQNSISALDLLAATYSDTSDSEVDDFVDVDNSHPFAHSEIILDRDITGDARLRPPFSASDCKSIREGTQDGLMSRSLDGVSSIPINLNYSPLEQDTSFNKVPLQSVDHFSTIRECFPYHGSAVPMDPCNSGSELLSMQSGGMQEHSIPSDTLCKSLVKETLVCDTQPIDESENRNAGDEGALAWASGSKLSFPNLGCSSIGDGERLTVSSIEASGNICADGNFGGCTEECTVKENTPDIVALNGRTTSLWKPCKGFMRPHVFCLKHALEVEEQLNSMGGAHLLLLCHANYPKIEEQAKLLAKEMGVDTSWKNISFKNAVEDDLEMIAVAIEEETDAELGSDWTARLGVNLRHSVKLSKSPLYNREIPCSRVLDALFCSSAPVETEDCERKINKHKKITVAGKWCGKIWMVKQVHPYLGGINVHHEPASVSNHIGFSEGGRSRGRPRKQNILNSDCKSMSEESNTKYCDDQTYFPSVNNVQDKFVNRCLLRKRKLNQKELIYDSKTNIQISEDMVLDSLEKVKTGNYSSDQAKSGDISSEQYDSYKQHTQLLSPTAIGARLSLPRSCRNTSKGKSRHKAKKPGWNHSIEVLQNPAETIQCKNNVLASEKDVVPGSEVPLSSEPDASKEQINLHISPKSDNLPLGPRTRLRTRSTQANEPKVAAGVDKMSGKQGRVLSASKGKKVGKSSFSDDTEDEGSYHCDVEGCIMNFHTKQELLMHKRNACTVKGCGKRFGSHKYLLQHRKVHLDDRPLKCPWKSCKMTFKWAWARTEHIRVHTGERPYVCQIAGCGRTFRFVSDFSRHKRKTGHGKQQ